jgi:hypothetical protein
MIERDESRLIEQENKNRAARSRSIAAHGPRPLRRPREAAKRDLPPR